MKISLPLMQTFLQRIVPATRWAFYRLLGLNRFGPHYPKQPPWHDDEMVRRVENLKFERDVFLFLLRGWIKEPLSWTGPLPEVIPPNLTMVPLGRDASWAWMNLSALRRRVIETKATTVEGAEAKLRLGVLDGIDWEIVVSAM